MLLFYDLQSESLALKLHRVSGVYRFSFFNFYVLYERPPYVLSSVAAFFHNNLQQHFLISNTIFRFEVSNNQILLLR